MPDLQMSPWVIPNAILNQPLQRDNRRAAVQQAGIEHSDSFSDGIAHNSDFFVLTWAACPSRDFACVDGRQEQNHELIGERRRGSKAD
jgi:hypothetical protein